MIVPLSSAPKESKSYIRRSSTRSRTRARAHSWRKLLLRPDISDCLAFSRLRCVISIISIVLLATDIPRSGVGVRRLDDYYPRTVMADTAVRFGPYDYPIRHIWRSDNDMSKFVGLAGTDPVDSANIWSYQYDTTSIGLRGAVELLNVSGFPDFLLYRGQLGQANNHDGVLSLNTTFFMLDALISAAQAQLLHNTSTDSRSAFRFATKHNWVDRVHQYLTRFFKMTRSWSLHSLHTRQIAHQTRSLQICSLSGDKPRFCAHPVPWYCEHPSNASLPAVRVWDHMDLRFQELQQQYPALTLDVVLVATHRPFMTSGSLRYTIFNCEEQEIVMLTRGRRCTSECTTVFVDDYRYERNLLQTNIVDWYFFIAMMRGGAQGYFWARLVLLYVAAFFAAEAPESGGQFWHSRIMYAIVIVFKIPFQVIVYSSPLPVAAYAVALLLDGNFMDIYLDSFWSSLEGATNFEFVAFLNSAVTQMRTVWLMALLVDLMVFVARKPSNGSEEKIPGVRGLVISFTSAMTVVGPYKHTFFRNSKVVTAIRSPHAGQNLDVVKSGPQWYFNGSTYLFGDSMTMLLLCIAIVAAVAGTARLMGHLMRMDRDLILISTVNVPYGTESLWPTSSLSIRFNALRSCAPYQYDLRKQPSLAKLSSELRHPSINLSKVSPSSAMSQARKTTGFAMTSWNCCRRNRAPSVPTRAQSAGGLCARTAESHSILQLMNIAMMTDPWNFIWLRVIGVPLYLYRIRPARSATSGLDNSTGLLWYAVILPYPEAEMGSARA